MSAKAGSFLWAVSTPDGVVASGESAFLVVPTVGGELGVLADHAALVACVAPGELRVTEPGGVRVIAVGAGVVDIRDNRVSLLVSSVPPRPTEPAGPDAGAPPSAAAHTA